ncbi:right-handed parallel beta-helix repeat-containing protein [Planococcus sp. CPCC 101016]|uniref:right-handed parallel beta-helix repeat-containing protein n=1 Tax=Planococcus sp. CPCC 101016 TaxID=2599617 RepID=UPI0011B4DC3C|nr:right-handed parallel beta-helix repeat-containing protein [Planococcus sp. CPCC 101016]TWT07115.1 right-handed parallel beta-helix repeat-containing protein [Planococcus sp. CPCC 101016]
MTNKMTRWFLYFLGIYGLTLVFFMGKDFLFSEEQIDAKTQFGAEGDGMTDDTQAIQTAIDETPIGETLRIPAGLYKLSKNPDFKAITGYGESYFALKISKPITIIMDQAIFQTEADGQYGVFWVTDTADVHLKGGFLIGDKMPESGSLVSNIAILLQDSQKSSIENVYTKNHSQGIHLHHANDNLIRNVTSEFNYGSGIINFASDYNTIESCIVRNSGDGHLSLFGGGKQNLVKGCVVTEDRKGFTDQQGITVESEKNSIIEKNTVSGFYYGIDIKNGADSNTIKGNLTYNNEYNIAVRPGDGGNNLMTPSHNISIINNLALNPREGSERGIYINIGDGHVIRGNTVEENNLILRDKELRVRYQKANFQISDK